MDEDNLLQNDKIAMLTDAMSSIQSVITPVKESTISDHTVQENLKNQDYGDKEK